MTDIRTLQTTDSEACQMASKKPLYTNGFQIEKPLGINNFFKATDFVAAMGVRLLNPSFLSQFSADFVVAAGRS